MSDAPLLDWLETHETKQPDWLWNARAHARRLLKTREWITVDDIREACPPPREAHPTVMGAVFKHADFEPTGEYVPSRRPQTHGRPIMKFRLTNFYRVHEALGMTRN